MQIGAYTIERELGRGGFGVVYAGVDTRLGRRAAIKQLLPELSHRRDLVDRFFNEARAAAAIDHPGIVEIYEVGWHEGAAFFAMKLLDGDSLSRRLRAVGMMPVGTATAIARQVASALSAAHARGIVHRDLKPDNIVLVPDSEVAIGERATILDFGIAKLAGDLPVSQRTATGMMLGTPAYMSPEQCRGAGEADQRSDIYALGCILFEMLAGRPPFVGGGGGEVLGMHQFVETPSLRTFRADAPIELTDLVARALAKKPEDRFAQMADFAAALQPFAGAVSRGEAPVAMPVERNAPTMHSMAVDVHAPTAASPPPPPPVPPLASAPPPRSARTTRRGWILALGGLLTGVAIVGIAFQKMRVQGDRRRDDPTDSSVRLMDGSPFDAATDASIEAAIDAAIDAAQHSAEYDACMSAAPKWSDVLKCASRLPEPERHVLKDRVMTVEEPASIKARTVMSALTSNKFVDAYHAFREIDPTTFAYPDIHRQYKVRAQSYVVKNLGSLGGNCPMLLERLATYEVELGTEVADLAREEYECTKRCGNADWIAMLDAAAQERFARGQNAAGLAVLDRVLACDPATTEWLMATLTACKGGDAERAKRYFAHLNAADRSTAQETCPDLR